MTSIPLKDMTFEEKMQAMELLWDDLCHGTEPIESPDWHHGLLENREQAVNAGEDAFEDWEIAKKNIRNAIK